MDFEARKTRYSRLVEIFTNVPFILRKNTDTIGKETNSLAGKSFPCGWRLKK